MSQALTQEEADQGHQTFEEAENQADPPAQSGVDTTDPDGNCGCEVGQAHCESHEDEPDH